MATVMITLAMMHKSRQTKIGQRYVDSLGNVYLITNILGGQKYLARNVFGRGMTRTFTFEPLKPHDCGTLYLAGDQTVSLPMQQ